MTEYNMPQYILREFKVTDARVGPSFTWMANVFVIFSSLVLFSVADPFDTSNVLLYIVCYTST